MNGRLGALAGERARRAGAVFGAGFASGVATRCVAALGVVAAGEAAGRTWGLVAGADAAAGGGTSATGAGFVSTRGFVSARGGDGSGCHGSVAIR